MILYNPFQHSTAIVIYHNIPTPSHLVNITFFQSGNEFHFHYETTNYLHLQFTCVSKICWRIRFRLNECLGRSDSVACSQRPVLTTVFCILPVSRRHDSLRHRSALWIMSEETTDGNLPIDSVVWRQLRPVFVAGSADSWLRHRFVIYIWLCRYVTVSMILLS